MESLKNSKGHTEVDAWCNSPEVAFTNMMPTLFDARTLLLKKLIIITSRKQFGMQLNKKRNHHFMWQLKIFIGVLIFSGYHRLLSECDSWSDGENLGVQIVIDVISRNRYLEIKSFLYFPK